jgi:hypothetical protein
MRMRPVGTSWRMVEIYERIKGSWKYLYQAIDESGATVDFLLTVEVIAKTPCASYARRPAITVNRRRSPSTRGRQRLRASGVATVSWSCPL